MATTADTVAAVVIVHERILTTLAEGGPPTTSFGTMIEIPRRYP
jgi:hypothetical protein